MNVCRVPYVYISHLSLVLERERERETTMNETRLFAVVKERETERDTKGGVIRERDRDRER